MELRLVEAPDKSKSVFIITAHNIVYAPFVIVTVFADKVPNKPQSKTKAKPEPINGIYTNRQTV
jgi:hypothetical protein